MVQLSKSFQNTSEIKFSIAFFILFLIISFQNIIAMFIAPYSYTVALSIMALKEFYLFIIIFLLMLKIIVKQEIDIDLLIPLSMILFLLIFSLFLSPYFNFMSLRQLLILPVFILTGYYFIDKVNIFQVQNWIYLLFLIIIGLALFERFILNYPEYVFFHKIGIKDWSDMKGWGYNIPGSWYTGDLRILTGEYHRRMPGILIGDAVNFGQFLVFPMIYSILRKKYLLTLIITLAIILSFSKGAILATSFGLLLYYSREKLKLVERNILKFGALFVVIVMVKSLLPYLKQIGSVMDHFFGLFHNINNLPQYPFGQGIGSGGNFAKRFLESGYSIGSLSSNIDASSVALGESYFGTMIAQIGIFGILFYFYYFKKLYNVKISENDILLKSAQYSLLGLFFVGFFTETAFTYIGTGMITVFIPFIINYNKSPNYEKQIY